MVVLIHSTASRVYVGHNNLIIFFSINIDQPTKIIEAPNYPFTFLSYSRYIYYFTLNIKYTY